MSDGSRNSLQQHGHSRRARDTAFVGLAYIWFGLGLSIVLQLLLAEGRGPAKPGWLPNTPPSWLVVVGLAGAVVTVACWLGARVTRPVLVFAALAGVWVSSPTLSAWWHSGQFQWRWLLLAAAAVGLVLAAATAPAMWTAWSIVGFSAAYTYANLYAIYRAYYSLGTSYSIAGNFREIGPIGLPDFDPPGGHVGRIIALVVHLWQPEVAMQPMGLAGNPNLTGNYLAALLAFSLVMALRFHPTKVRVWPYRALLIGFVVLPGVYLMNLLSARAAIVGLVMAAVVSLVRLPESASSMVAAAVAGAMFLVVLVPVVVSQAVDFSISGRDALWSDWWSAMTGQSIFGLGPPGGFEGQFQGSDIRWSHAHNELLQSWNLGGLVGLGACVGALVMLAWFGLRYWRWDDRALLAVLTCCLVLMSVEVLSTVFEVWPALGLAGLLVVAGRSLGMMTLDRPRQSPTRSPVSGEVE